MVCAVISAAGGCYPHNKRGTCWLDGRPSCIGLGKTDCLEHIRQSIHQTGVPTITGTLLCGGLVTETRACEGKVTYHIPVLEVM